MKSGMDYLLGQLLSLVFYIMTLIIYNRARREYVGGKIADAINLIMIFLAILLLADAIDYFLAALLPVGADTTLIIKILFKLLALSVLFFGGLRFFSKRPLPAQTSHDIPLMEGIESLPASPGEADASHANATVALSPKPKPSLGRYEIIEQIGRGAMGVVYKGRDPKLQRLTAIKTIRFIDDYDEDKVEKVKSHFYREAEVVARLSHKNIVKIFDVGEDLDLSYLAMEYLEGDDLEKYCNRETPLPLKTTLEIIVQVCDALDYAHSKGIVHRDIKPGNIMVLKTGEIKVTDFGIARAAGSTKTRTGTIKGTPYYMSPEQAKGVTLTGTADIFSLGVVFYQLLAGKLPFEGENLASIMYQTTNADPVPPDKYNSEVGQPIMDILNRALMKDPQTRYQTAGQMAAEMRQLQRQLAPGADDSESGNGLIDLAENIAGEPTADNQDVAMGVAGNADQLDFSDLDKVMTMETDQATLDRSTNFDPQERIPAGDGIHAEDVVDTMDLSGSQDTLADREVTSAVQPVPRPRSVDTHSYKVVKTLPSVLPGTRDDEDSQPNDRPATSDRKGMKAFFTNRNIRLAASGLIVLVAIGFGYLFFWHSPEAENRILKSVYHKYFQSEEVKQKQRMEQQRQLVKKIMQQKLLEKQRQASQQDEMQKTIQEQQKEVDEHQKEQQTIVQKKLEEARNKQEAERQARIAAEKKEEQKRLQKIKTQKEREKKRQAALEAEKKAEAQRIAERERQKTETMMLNEIKAVETLMAAASAERQKKNYTEAKNSYEAALQAIADSRFGDDEKMIGFRRTAETALTGDDIVYGSKKGYVLYKNKWVSPQELEMIRYSEGYVKYKGAFRDHKTLKKPVEKMTTPLIQKYISGKFSGQTVHSKSILFEKMVLTRNNEQFSEYSVYFKWKVSTFKGMEDDICRVDIKYTVEADKWSLVKGCE